MNADDKCPHCKHVDELLIDTRNVRQKLGLHDSAIQSLQRKVDTMDGMQGRDDWMRAQAHQSDAPMGSAWSYSGRAAEASGGRLPLFTAPLTRFESEQPRRGPLVRPRRLREDGVRAVANRETRRRHRRRCERVFDVQLSCDSGAALSLSVSPNPRLARPST